MKITAHSWTLIVGTALVAPCACSRTARADVAIAADLDYALPLEDATDSGAGFGVRLGRRFDAPLIALTPELAATYHGFSGGYAPAVYRGMAGLRLDVGEVFTPGAFAHVGVGRLTGDTLDGKDPSRTSFAFDAGGFLDFTVIPLINVGAHAAYNFVGATSDTKTFGWATFGLHAALIF